MLFRILKPTIHFPREIEVHFDPEVEELIQGRMEKETPDTKVSRTGLTKILDKESGTLFYTSTYGYGNKGSRPYTTVGMVIWCHRGIDIVDTLKADLKVFFNKCGKNFLVDIEDETSITFKIE